MRGKCLEGPNAVALAEVHKKEAASAVNAIVGRRPSWGVPRLWLCRCIKELRRPAQGGGFLAGLFSGGGGQRDSAPIAPNAPASMQSAAPLGMGNSAHFGRGTPQSQPGRGGGFLAGAAQTAMGVAGGVLIGSMLGNAFGGGSDKKAEAAPAAAPESETTAANDGADADAGDDFGDGEA